MTLEDFQKTLRGEEVEETPALCIFCGNQVPKEFAQVHTVSCPALQERKAGAVNKVRAHQQERQDCIDEINRTTYTALQFGRALKKMPLGSEERKIALRRFVKSGKDQAVYYLRGQWGL